MLNVNEQITQIDQEIYQLQQEKNKLANLPVEKQVAIVLHGTLCQSSHVDQCDWHNDPGDWSTPIRQQYIKLSVGLLEEFTQDQIETFLRLFYKNTIY